MNPIVSVIIPTFNRWPMVGEAVQSVLAQDYRDFELIVVDDGSTDETAYELAKFGSRLSCLRQPRKGVAAARNLGVLHSRGDQWIAFLDSDDLWHRDKLRLQIEYMAAHPELEICQTEEIWVRNGVRVNPKVKHRKPSGEIFARSLDLCLVSPSAVMMHKQLFESVGGFDETLPVCEDYDLWLRIGLAHPVGLLDRPLVTKRGGHADQLSRSTWGFDWYRVVALRKLLRAGVSGDRRWAVLNELTRKLTILAQGAGKRGKAAQAREYFAVLGEFSQEIADVGERVSQLRGIEGLSSADAGPLA